MWQTPDLQRAPAWTDALGPILEPLRGDHPGFRDEQGRGPLDLHPAFDGLHAQEVAFTWRPTREVYVAYIASASFLAALPPEEKADVSPASPPPCRPRGSSSTS